MSGDLDVLKNLTIQGAGPGLTIIDGGLVDGVFDVLAPNTVTITGVTIRNGLSLQAVQAGGGGIRNFGTLTLTNAIVSGNESARGPGGIRNFGGGIRNSRTLTLTNVTVTGNIARGGGGGIYNELGAVMTLTDVTVSANRSEIDGAGIYNLGAATLANVTVNGNNADVNAGGIFTGGIGASATLTNVTVSGNTATASGGGIFNSAAMALTNVTVTANSANFSGGGIVSFSSGLPATLKNVIVSGNTDPVVAGTANCSGAITSLGHNLDNGATCGFTGPGDLTNADPLLGPLQNNGGLTFTQALLAGSPAIDAGTNAGCPVTDQRGSSRGICDIGAYESAAGAPAPTLVMLPASLPGGTVGTAYSQTVILSVSNGVRYTAPAPSFAVAAGVLPAGLVLDPATGVLHGTPTAGGSFSFTLGAVDAKGFSASQSYTLAIASAVNNDTFFVSQLYRDVWNVTADPAGVSTWVSRIAAGATRAQVAEEFFNDARFYPSASYLAKLFLGPLQRDPDFATWSSMFAQMQGGVTRAQVLASIMSRPDYQSVYGKLTDLDFVTALYQNILGRAPEAAGLNFWLTVLKFGVPRSTVLDLFVTSPEYDPRAASRVKANLMYFAFLRRTGEPAGLNYWTTVLNFGVQPVLAIQGFISSPEYLARF